MERIDKIIATQTEYSRKDVKKMISQKKIEVDGKIIKSADEKINENAVIKISGKELNIQKNIYLILNKPKGYISATEDKNMKTVLDLVPEKYQHRALFPAGRLDKDTTGMMIITDDGKFAHNILSPKKHIKKRYNVTIDIPVTKEMITGFERGIQLNDGECKKALLEITGEYTADVTITEGRYHQIKRMFGCYGAKVIELNRVQMGEFILPSNLKLGQCREITVKEMEQIIKK